MVPPMKRLTAESPSGRLSLGSGSFGEVFLAKWKQDSTQLVNNVIEPRSGLVRSAQQLTVTSDARCHLLIIRSPPSPRIRDTYPCPYPLQLAIKVLRGSSLTDPRAISDFKAEARGASSLSFHFSLRLCMSASPRLSIPHARTCMQHRRASCFNICIGMCFRAG